MTKIWQGCGAMGTSLHYDGNVELYNHLGVQFGSFSKSKTCTYCTNQPFHPCVLPKRKENVSTQRSQTFSQVYPKCLPIGDWVAKPWYIYTMEYYSAIKKKGTNFPPPPKKGTNLKHAILITFYYFE